MDILGNKRPSLCCLPCTPCCCCTKMLGQLCLLCMNCVYCHLREQGSHPTSIPPSSDASILGKMRPIPLYWGKGASVHSVGLHTLSPARLQCNQGCRDKRAVQHKFCLHGTTGYLLISFHGCLPIGAEIQHTSWMDFGGASSKAGV